MGTMRGDGTATLCKKPKYLRPHRVVFKEEQDKQWTTLSKKKSLKYIPYIYTLAILSCLQLKQCIGKFHHASLWKSDPKKSMDQRNKRCTSPFRAASLSSSTCCPARRFNPILCARKTNQVSQWPHESHGEN